MGLHVLQTWALAPVKACLPLGMDYCNGARPPTFTHKTRSPYTSLVSRTKYQMGTCRL